MMKNRQLVISIMLAVLLLTLSACAANGGSTAQPATAPPSAEPPQETVQSAAAPQAEQAEPAQPVDTQPAQPLPQQDQDSMPAEQDLTTGEVLIYLEYEKQSGSASNQFAVWIEDPDGQLVKTLYATRWTANGGYRNRPDAIALWVEKSGLASLPKSEVDAISGATPRTGAYLFSWDLTDVSGSPVLPGEYQFFVEGTLRWRNYVLHSGLIEVGGAATTAVADATFVYEASDRQAALTSDSPENSMITNVSASYTPQIIHSIH
jgi:hypothetical protein